MRYSYLQGQTWHFGERVQENTWESGIRRTKEHFSSVKLISELFETIDQIVFINLSTRKDRLRSINDFLSKCDIPVDKITRFEAIGKEQQRPLTRSVLNSDVDRTIPEGALGCTWSHIGVLKKAKENGWKKILVLEDDVESVTTPKQFIRDLVTGLRETKEFDVLMLAWNNIGLGPEVTGVTSRGRNLQTTSAYIVGEHFYETLMIDFIESAANQVALDINWFGLQERSKFYAFTPRILNQAASYSDIENRYVDYGV